MHLPKREEVASDPFLNLCYETDKKQFLSARRGANQRWMARRRVLTSLALMKKFIPKPGEAKGARIADLGCGTANVGLLLAEEGYTVDLVDFEAKFLDYAKMKSTSANFSLVHASAGEWSAKEPYYAVFFGEAIEHVAEPDAVLRSIRKNMLKGGILCLTTPNGDFLGCREPSWSEVKDQKERNARIANTLGNHVCEFRQNELRDVVKAAGFSILEHKLILSDRIAGSSLLRRALPEAALFALDDRLSKRLAGGKSRAITQIVVAQKVGD